MTKLHINAVLGMVIMGVLSIGLVYILITENGSLPDDRFIHIAALIGVCIWGIRETTKYFAQQDANSGTKRKRRRKVK